MDTQYKRSKTTDFFYKLSYVVYFFGLPNFWMEDLKLSKRFVRFYDKFSMFNNGLIYLLVLFELASFFTQKNLTEKQKSNLLLYALSHPMLCCFRVMMSNLKDKVRLVMYNLTVGLKAVHNDPEVERQMLASTYMYLFALLLTCLLSMVMYAAVGIWEVACYGATFTTLVTAYPDVEDRSDLANVVRALCFIIWWIFLTRIFAVYMLVIPLTTCLSHQYKNLQSYFSNLNEIFERNDLSQTEKEEKFEAGVKVGIKLHTDTLQCTQLTQTVCRGVFSGQIVFNICLLVVLMAQMANSERTLMNLCAAVLTASSVLISTGFYMWNAGDVTVENSERTLMNLCAAVLTASSVLISTGFYMWNAGDVTVENSERTLMNLCAAVLTASSVLISTGFYMWNAGDVTVEASHLGTAIYFSGWNNCHGQCSVRIRKLIVITMCQAQQPVVLKGLGYIDLSYESYIKIVKSSYSVFSVLF